MTSESEKICPRCQKATLSMWSRTRFYYECSNCGWKGLQLVIKTHLKIGDKVEVASGNCEDVSGTLKQFSLERGFAEVELVLDKPFEEVQHCQKAMRHLDGRVVALPLGYVAKIRFTQDEENFLSDYMRKLTEESKIKYTYTLNNIVDRWEGIVFDVENVYPLDTIWDYTNDLCMRDIIKDIQALVSEPLKSKLDSIIDSLDRRFYEATLEVEKSLMNAELSKSDAPWWYRIPKKRGLGLNENLISFGYIP